MIHGQAGNYLDNKFGAALGELAADQGYDYIFTHNRGWGIVNDIVTTQKNKDGGYDMVRCGAVYERFTDCVKDIDAWKQYALEKGYQQLILIGHSLGCPKLIYYLSQTNTKNIAGLVLASPADMVGSSKKEEGSQHQELVYEAKANLDAGQRDKLLSQPLWNWITLSSQTFLDESVDGCPADVLPLLRQPDTFPELASINIPILTLFAQNDSITIHSVEKDLDIIQSKAITCPHFTRATIPHTDHCYADQEQHFANTILNWINNTL